MKKVIRPHAEDKYARELEALKKMDKGEKPKGWELSPKSVVDYILGTELPDGTPIEAKYIGQRRAIEIAVATLATDRALLLLGVPGTAKTWLAENLAAAISGHSSLLVQGTAGLGEEALRYNWNYARLIAEGPSENALVPSPVMIGMQKGKMVRVEELTRIPSDIQDVLITILSEKVLSIPELNQEIAAVPGFNIIATANDRDRGVNELSSALRRRFNTLIMPLPEKLEEEVKIVSSKITDNPIPFKAIAEQDTLKEIERLVTIFRELRNGITEDGTLKVKSPSGTLSAAEAISVVNNGLTMSHFFGDGRLSAKYLIDSIEGAVVQDRVQDQLIWNEYLETVVKERAEWKDLYEAALKKT
ncbi:MAG: ATP-binding protein [Saprospiraceae bacterium]|jgi:MoxR-like ATPase